MWCNLVLLCSTLKGMRHTGPKGPVGLYTSSCVEVWSYQLSFQNCSTHVWLCLTSMNVNQRVVAPGYIISL
jgi:hypothetical protein